MMDRVVQPGSLFSAKAYYMSRVLIVEDSVSVAKMLRFGILSHIDVEVDVVGSVAEAEAAVKGNADYFVAVAGLYLPDGPDGQIVDTLRAHDVAVIVLTGSMDEAVRREVLRKHVVDYVIKQHQSSIEYVSYLIRRLYRNRELSILIVDDSVFQRRYLRLLLEIHRFNVLEAEGGEQALQVLESEPGIAMVITDYEMPKMNGKELVSRIRQSCPREELSIIGVSGRGSAMSAHLLKAGASDYLAKPFIVEEFYCRVNQNIDIIEQVRAIKDASTRDFLTGLHNRKFLYETGGPLFENAKRSNFNLTAAMLDIDFFKKINDNYGHQIGDEALRHTAAIISQRVRKADIVVRYGGEEFCILAVSSDGSSLVPVFEKLRSAVQSQPLITEDGEINITLSIGVSTVLGETMDELLDNADKMLYRAKAQGRNCVVSDEAEQSA